MIGQEQDGTWSMYYLQANGAVVATLVQGRSREDILRQTKECTRGHGKQIIENLIDDSEKYLGSMNCNQQQRRKRNHFGSNFRTS